MKIKKTLLFLFVSINSYCQQQDSTLQIKKQLKTLDEFFFNYHGLDTLPPKKIRPKKNTIYGQLFGDTPFIGIGYRRRIYSDKSILLETGIGVGFAPKLEINHIPRPKNWSYSHHINLVYRKWGLINPVIGYSGVLYSGTFFKEKMFNYLPSPNFGLRLGNNDSFAINLLYTTYFFKREYDEYFTLDYKRSIVEKKYVSTLSFGMQYSF